MGRLQTISFQLFMHPWIFFYHEGLTRILSRWKKPVITKDDISAADMLDLQVPICQLSTLLIADDNPLVG